MSQEIVKQLNCILLKNGIELWMEKEKAIRVMMLVEKAPKGTMIRLEDFDCEFGREEVSGRYTAKLMEDRLRLRQGQWKGKDGKWHDKNTRSCPKCGRELDWGKSCGYCS
jgi:hypothetical protein